MNTKLKKIFLSESDNDLNRIVSALSCFITGMLAHGYFIFNQIFNGDSVYVPHGASPILASGRWAAVLLNYFLRVHLKNSLVIHSFNIILGIIFLSLCSALIIEIFKVKNIFVSIAIGSLLVVQPFVINLIGYSFVFHFDFFTLLITVYSAKLLLIDKAVVVPSILIGVALGIYQAYYPFLMSIIFVYYFLYILEGNDIKKIFPLTIKVIAVLVISIIIFIIGNFLTQSAYNSSINGYVGMGKSGLPSSGVQGIIANILTPYKYFIGIYTGRYGHVTNFPIMKLCIIMLLIIFLISMFKFLKNLYNNSKVNFIISIIFILLIPICVCMQGLYYFGNTARVQTNTCFLYFIPLLLLDRLGTENYEYNILNSYLTNNYHFKKIFSTIILYLFIFISVHFVFVSNGEHYRLYLINKKYERSLQNIVNVILSNKDYRDGMEIMICGRYKTPSVIMDNFDMSPFDIHDPYSDITFTDEITFSFAHMQIDNLKIYLQVPPEDRAKYKDIPNYPNPECVQKIGDNLLLIKFSD